MPDAIERLGLSDYYDCHICSSLAVTANLSTMTASSMLSSNVFSEEIRMKFSNLFEVMLDLTADLTLQY